jgi:hypothetical protein
MDGRRSRGFGFARNDQPKLMLHECLDRLSAERVSTRLQRRAFLSRTGVAMGAMALPSLLPEILSAGLDNDARRVPGLVGLPHFAPRAKRAIFLCMAGGPSHLETFDYKPKLAQLHGQPMPPSVTAGQPVAQLQGKELTAYGPMMRFAQYGKSGQWISELFPWQQKLADDICIVRSIVTDQINHDPAHTFLNTGTAISGRPSMGAWITYGLGTETNNLPGFIVLTSIGGRKGDQPIASRQWSAGFLPNRFQGIEFNSTGEPVHYINSPPGVSRGLQQASVEAISALDKSRADTGLNRDVAGRIAAFETAFRMQTSVPQLMDMSEESAATFALYGASPGDGSFASNCLLARRLLEQGVRFVQLYHRGWDHHGNLEHDIRVCAQHTDKASYALLTDLKRRGMLDDTLVIWGGEFGRTPMVQVGSGSAGRDHHIKGYSMWLAGGGIRPGSSYGATDDLGYHAVENVVHVHDLHATMLHLLGIDHRRLSYRFQGRDFRLTDVHGNVVHDLIS